MKFRPYLLCKRGREEDREEGREGERKQRKERKEKERGEEGERGIEKRNKSKSFTFTLTQMTK